MGEHTRSTLATRISNLRSEPTKRTSAEPKIPTVGSSPGTEAAEVSRPVSPPCKRLSVLGSSATEPDTRLLESERSRLSDDACELERAQRARAEFIKTNPQLVDRINQLRRAVHTQQTSSHLRRSGRSAPTRPPSGQPRNAALAFEVPPLPVERSGPDL